RPRRGRGGAARPGRPRPARPPRGRRPADIGSPSPSPHRSHNHQKRRRPLMKLYQTPEGGPVIEHDGALWQPTGDAETPNLQFHDGDLAEYGWEPYTGPRDGLTPVAERQPGRRLPRLLATPDSLSETAWEFLRAQDNHVGLYVAQGWGDGEWVNVEIGMYTLGHTPGHTPYYEKILARHLDNCDKRRHHRRTRPALDELRVLTWEGDSREPEEHTLTPERVARLLADRRQDAEQQLREAEGRVRRRGGGGARPARGEPGRGSRGRGPGVRAHRPEGPAGAGGGRPARRGVDRRLLLGRGGPPCRYQGGPRSRVAK